MKPVDEHLQDDVELARRVHRALRELPDAPAACQQAAIALWPQAAGSPVLEAIAQTAQSAAAVVRALVAALTFDSWATSGLALGMRAGRSTTRHLLYSAAGRDIDLRVMPMAEHFAISGQVLGPDEAGRVELALADSRTGAGGVAVRVGQLDELGDFRLEDVPAGRYVMTLHVGPQPIVVEPIDVGEPPA